MHWQFSKRWIRQQSYTICTKLSYLSILSFLRIWFGLQNIAWYFLVLQNLLALSPKYLEIQERLSSGCNNCHNLSSLSVDSDKLLVTLAIAILKRGQQTLILFLKDVSVFLCSFALFFIKYELQYNMRLDSSYSSLYS